MNDLYKPAIIPLGTMLACAALFFGSMALSSCMKKPGEPKMYGERVFTRVELSAITGWPVYSFNKPKYLGVTKEWMEWHHKNWRAEFSSGWTDPKRWSKETLCTTFTTMFTGSVSKEFFRYAFHDFLPEGVHGVAAIEYWYTTDSGGGHAITAFVTPDGEVFFLEPQTLAGHNPIVQLSSAEKSKFIRVKVD